MLNVKKLMLLAALAALLVSVGFVSSACGARSGKNAQADTLVVNTTELCKDVIGYDGRTVFDGIHETIFKPAESPQPA